MKPADVVQAQFDAYNAQDVDKLCSYYADDCVFTDLKGAVTMQGREAFRARFTKTFAEHPHNKARSLNRICVGNVVVDHEVGERKPGGDGFEIVAIYTIEDGKIASLAMGNGQ